MGSAAATLSVESVTFVSPEQGWVLGTLPCSAAPACLALLRTEDGGRSWVSVTPPPSYPYPAAGADGGVSGGVSEVRFANSQDGWVFGPDLWSTHNGGATWTQIPIAGPASTQYVVVYHSVANLETSDGFVYALVSNGDGFEIEMSPIGVDAWRGVFHDLATRGFGQRVPDGPPGCKWVDHRQRPVGERGHCVRGRAARRRSVGGMAAALHADQRSSEPCGIDGG